MLWGGGVDVVDSGMVPEDWFQKANQSSWLTAVIGGNGGLLQDCQSGLISNFKDGVFVFMPRKEMNIDEHMLMTSRLWAKR